MQRPVFFGPHLGWVGQNLFVHGQVGLHSGLSGEIWDIFEKNVEDIQEVAKGIQDPFPNLTVAETQALEDLSQRRDIIIKQLKQGGAVVIMDRPQYVQEGLLCVSWRINTVILD